MVNMQYESGGTLDIIFFSHAHAMGLANLAKKLFKLGGWVKVYVCFSVCVREWTSVCICFCVCVCFACVLHAYAKLFVRALISHLFLFFFLFAEHFQGKKCSQQRQQLNWTPHTPPHYCTQLHTHTHIHIQHSHTHFSPQRAHVELRSRLARDIFQCI